MPNTLRGEKIPGGEYSKTLRGEKAPTFSRGRKFPGEIVPGGSKCQMTQGGECSRGSIVKNVEGGVYSRGENELSVRGGEAWYSGGRKCQGGEGLRGEKVCKPYFLACQTLRKQLLIQKIYDQFYVSYSNDAHHLDCQK